MHRAFTLIELVLSLALVSSMLLLMFYALDQMLSMRERALAIERIEDDGIYAVDVISRAIRQSVNVNSPASGATSTSLTLSMPAGFFGSTTVSLSSSTIIFVDGGVTSTVSGKQYQASGLVFQAIAAGTEPSVLFSFTLSASSSRYEFSYSKQFRGVGTRR